MATRAATKIKTSRLLFVLAAFAFVFTSIFYIPSSGSRSAAQLNNGNAPTVAMKGAKVDPLLVKYFSTSAAGATVPVVITYKSRPSTAEFNRLQSIGIKKGFALRRTADGHRADERRPTRRRASAAGRALNLGQPHDEDFHEREPELHRRAATDGPTPK